jgi:gamma-tubulin complex component 3
MVDNDYASVYESTSAAFANKDEEKLDSVGEIIRRLHEDQHPSESRLLQDLPYTLQGLKTEYFGWSTAEYTNKQSENKTSICLSLPPTVPWPLVGLLNELLEPALLYKYLSENVVEHKTKSARSGGPSLGLVKQSLYSAIHDELQSY